MMRMARTLVLATLAATAASCRTSAQRYEPVASTEPASMRDDSAEVSPVRSAPQQSPVVELAAHEASTEPEEPPNVAITPVLPQEDETPVMAEAGMTLADLEAIAAAHNPSIRQASAMAQAACGIRDQVGRCANPTVGYVGEEIGSNGTAGMQGGFISQTFVLGHKLQRNVVVAEQQVQALRWQVETQRLRVRNDVRLRFYETLGAQRRIELTDNLERLAEAGVETARALEAALQASRADVLQAEIQRNEVQILRENAEAAYRASRKQLAATVGCPEWQIDVLLGSLEDGGGERHADVALQQLLAESPAVQQAAADVRRARAVIDREEAQPIPNLQTNLGVMHNNSNGYDVATVSLGLPLPIFNDNGGNITRAAAEYHQACANLDRVKLSLTSQLAETYGQYEQARDRVRIYREQVLPRESESLELIVGAYPVQFDFLRVLSARRSFFEAQLRYLDALVELRKSEVALDGLLLTGGLSALPDARLDDSMRGQALSGQ